MLIDVLRVEGGLEVPSAQATVTAGELDHAIKFQNLRFNTTYKLFETRGPANQLVQPLAPRSIGLIAAYSF